MGPRFFSRGNDAIREAAESGDRSFNGAAAFQPRKFVGARAIGNTDAASMGPRLFNRGNVAVELTRIRERSASMGPRFFNRGNQLATSSTLDGNGLQWGRGFSTAEIAVIDSGPRGQAPASMGPRFFNRGNGSTATVARPSRVPASMGPRLFNRGNSLDDLHGSGSTKSFNGAAAFQPRKFSTHPEPARKSRLQWGRGFSTAEMMRSRPRAARL